jgi:hypothetical protein
MSQTHTVCRVAAERLVGARCKSDVPGIGVKNAHSIVYDTSRHPSAIAENAAYTWVGEERAAEVAG